MAARQVLALEVCRFDPYLRNVNKPTKRQEKASRKAAKKTLRKQMKRSKK